MGGRAAVHIDDCFGCVFHRAEEDRSEAEQKRDEAMNKKKIIIVIIGIIILAVAASLIYIKLSNSPQRISQKLLKENYQTFVNASKEIKKFDARKGFSLAESDDLDASITHKDGAPLAVGDVVVYDYDSQKNIEALSSQNIKSILEPGYITHISKKDNVIVFWGDNDYSENKDYGEWGIYYSSDAKPNCDFFFYGSGSDLDFVKSEKGWMLELNDGQAYYTEKIKDNFYYFEGVQLP